LTAETFAKAFEMRGRFGSRTRDERIGWLWVIAREGLLRYRQGSPVDCQAINRLGLQLGPGFEEERVGVVKLARDTIEHNELYDAFRGLTPTQHVAIRMHVVYEFDDKLIAVCLKIKTTTVRDLLREGLSHLAGNAEPRPILEIGP
jgi:DNA-directed RNA polymerase specialized sigma24 family protein